MGFGRSGGGGGGEEGFGVGEEANDGETEGRREEGVKFEERGGEEGEANIVDRRQEVSSGPMSRREGGKEIKDERRRTNSTSQLPNTTPPIPPSVSPNLFSAETFFPVSNSFLT